MDFSSRGPVNPTPAHDANVNRTTNGSSSSSHKVGKGDWTHNKWYRVAQSVLVLCVLVVVVGLLAFLAISDWSNTSESTYVQSDRLQAVFLNTGQVYFGDITSVNPNYLVLTNIFYLQTANNGSSSSSSSSSSSTNNTVTLVKLGCEIHAPLDQMVINRTSITFWENLSPNGQVAKAVSTWEKQNPNGQKCSDQSTAGTAGQSTPQNATNNSSSSSNSTSTSTGSTH